MGVRRHDRDHQRKLVGAWAEDELVASLVAQWPPTKPERVPVGPGDDCALVRVGPSVGDGEKTGQLLKVDALLEGVHFLRSHPAERVGWKALARALSDVAAMGGKPQFGLVSLAVPEDLPWVYVRGLYRGMARAARRFDVQMVGGETSRSPTGIFLAVTLTGVVEAEAVRCRGGARAGDLLWVTGVLGRSYESGHHLRFVPRLREATWLQAHFPPTAMMDLSDGLGSDLPRLARQSGLGFALNLAAVPRRRGASLAQALADGEDYELLFTTPAEVAEELPTAWRRAFPRVRLTCLGRMEAGGPQELPLRGYEHFRPQNPAPKTP